MSPKTAYTDVIQLVAGSYGLPFDLLEAQVVVESAGDPMALRFEPDFFNRYIRTNPNAKALRYGPFAACSAGLLQIMVEVAYEIGFTGRPEELFSPRVGLAWGAKKLSSLWDGTPTSYPGALARYNGGVGGNETPPYRNIAYAEKVFAAAGKPMPT